MLTEKSTRLNYTEFTSETEYEPEGVQTVAEALTDIWNKGTKGKKISVKVAARGSEWKADDLGEAEPFPEEVEAMQVRRAIKRESYCWQDWVIETF